jgi:DNA replication and repair protein RecF
MRALHLAVRRVRNLADFDLELPAGGAVLLGPNGAGKTSLLECLYYLVLFRSFRGASDAEMCRWNAPGFRLVLEASGAGWRRLEVSFWRAEGTKRLLVDRMPVRRRADAVGRWLAVAFLPADVRLVGGPAADRRAYLDRVLALCHRSYWRSLATYRSALAQRNAALRTGRYEVGAAFDASLAVAGAAVVQARLAWVSWAADRFRRECDALAESGHLTLRYRGNIELADPAAWGPALAAARAWERARGMTLVGPHRDDLTLELDGRPLRAFGSAGQQRTAAVALKLCEWESLADAGSPPPLLLDDVFAELDRERQDRLAARLYGAERGQVFVTAARADELPRSLDFEVLELAAGTVRRRRVAA